MATLDVVTEFRPPERSAGLQGRPRLCASSTAALSRTLASVKQEQEGTAGSGNRSRRRPAAAATSADSAAPPATLEEDMPADWSCSSCGHTWPGSQKFCGECGSQRSCLRAEAEYLAIPESWSSAPKTDCSEGAVDGVAPVSSAAPDIMETADDHDAASEVDISALWNVGAGDIVRALCFEKPRRFLLALEAELVRLLEMPRGAILRLPAPKARYKALLLSTCARFSVDVSFLQQRGSWVVDISATLTSRLPLPAEALVPGTWAGRSPTRWRTELPKAFAKKPYLEMVMAPGHDFREYTAVGRPRPPAAPDGETHHDESDGAGDSDSDVTFVGYNGARSSSSRQLPMNSWDLQDAWVLADGSKPGGSVVTFEIDHEVAVGGVGIALCADSNAAEAPLRRLFQETADDCSKPEDEDEDPYVIFLEACRKEGCWLAEFGRASKVFDGHPQGARRAPWSDHARSAIWVSISRTADNRVQVETGLDCYPWRRLFRARLGAGCPQFQQFGLVGLCGQGASQGTADKACNVLLRSIRVENGLCTDMASRDHLLECCWPEDSGPTPESVADANVATVAWLPRSEARMLAVCTSVHEALDFQACAEAEGWEVCTLASAPIDTIEADVAQEGTDAESEPSLVRSAARAVLQSRIREVERLSDEAALDLGLTHWLQKSGRIEVAVREEGSCPLEEQVDTRDRSSRGMAAGANSGSSTVAGAAAFDRSSRAPAAGADSGSSKAARAAATNRRSRAPAAGADSGSSTAARAAATDRSSRTTAAGADNGSSAASADPDSPTPLSPEWVAQTAAALTGTSGSPENWEAAGSKWHKPQRAHWQESFDEEESSAHWQGSRQGNDNRNWQEPPEEDEARAHWQDSRQVNDNNTWDEEDASWKPPESTSWWSGQEHQARKQHEDYNKDAKAWSGSRQNSRNGSRKTSKWSGWNAPTWKDASWSENGTWPAEDDGSKWEHEASSFSESFSEMSWSAPSTKESSPQKDGESHQDRRRARLNQEHFRIAVDSHLRGVVQRQ